MRNPQREKKEPRSTETAAPPPPDAETRYRTLFDNAGDAILVHDMQGRLLDANQIACERLDYACPELVTLEPKDPANLKLAPEQIAKLRQNDQALFETTHRRRDGTAILVEMNSRLIELDGKPAILSIARDVTERNRRTLALQQERDLSAIILGTTGFMVVILDRDGCVVRFNEACERFFGLSLQEARGRTMWDLLIAPEERDRIQTLIADLNDGTPSVQYESFWATDDTLHLISWTATPLYEPDGGIAFTVCSGLDITEHKHAEESLHQREAELRALINGNPAVTFLMEPDGTVLIANEATAQRLETTVDQLIGACIYDFFPPDVAQTRRTQIEEAVRTGQLVHFEDSLGDRHWSHHISPITTEDGYVVGLVVLGVDITERKRAEEDLRWNANADAATAALSKAMISPLSIADLADQVLEQAKKLTESEFGYVGYIDPQTGYMIVPTHSREIWDVCQVEGKPLVFQEFRGLWGWVLENQQSLFTNYPQDDPRATGVPEGHVPIRRFLAVPALLGDEVIGQIALANPPRDYTLKDVAAVERLASIYTLAIQRRRMEEALAGETEVNAAVAALSQTLISPTPIDEVAVMVLQHAKQLTRSPFGYVGYVDPLTGHVVTTTLTNDAWDTCQVADKKFIFTEYKGLWGWVLQTHKPLLTNDPANDYRSGGVPEGHVPVQRFLSAPALLEEELVGQVALINADHDYTDRDLAIVERLAAIYALAIQRHRMEEALGWEIEVNSVIAALSETLISPTSIDDIAVLVLDYAKRLTHSPFGYVSYVDSQTNYIVASTLIHDVWDDCQVPDKSVVFKERTGLWGWVAQNQQSLLTNDPANDPRSGGVPEGHIPIQRFLSAPAILGGELVGQIVLANADHDYTPKDLRIAERLASLYSLALQRQHIEEALEWELEINASAAALAEGLVAPTSIEEMSYMVLEQAKKLTESQFGFVGYIDPQTGYMVVPTHSREVWDICRVAEKKLIFEKFTGLWGWVLLNRQPLLSNDPANDPRATGVPEGHVPVERIVAAPAMLNEELVGIVALINSPHNYTSKDVWIAERLASLYALTVQRQRASDGLQRHAHEQAALYAITSAVATTLDQNELLNTVLDVAMPTLDADAGWVTLPGATLDDPPQIVAHRYVPQSFVDAESSAPLLQCPVCAILLADDTQIALAEFTRCPRLPPEVLVEANMHSHIGIPLSAGGQFIGILNLGWRAPHPLTKSDRVLMRTVGRQVGMALRNAQLYQTARQIDRLRIIGEIGLTLTSTLDPAEVMNAALSQAKRLFRAEIVALLQTDSETGDLVFARAWFKDKFIAIPTHLHAGQGVTGWVFEHSQAVLVEDAQTDPRWVAWTTKFMDPHLDGLVRGLMAAPLVTRQKTVGVIAVAVTEPGIYNEDALSTLQAVAPTLAAALENSRLYEELKTTLAEWEKAQAQLIHSEKMGALGRLVASIAHEINNPLQAVQGCLSLAHEELDSGQRREKLEQYLNIAGSEIERVAAIVQRMRDFYRPSRPGMQSVNLHEVLDSVLALTNKQLQHSDVTVVREFDEGLPKIEANADQLKQVILNLVLNAADAMPKGGILSIRTAADEIKVDDRRRPAVRLEVTDTGIGMSEETLAHLFEPFFTTKEKGSGLGLSVSYGIVQAHNGDIIATSREGVGTTFTVRLPAE